MSEIHNVNNKCEILFDRNAIINNKTIAWLLYLFTCRINICWHQGKFSNKEMFFILCCEFTFWSSWTRERMIVYEYEMNYFITGKRIILYVEHIWAVCPRTGQILKVIWIFRVKTTQKSDTPAKQWVCRKQVSNKSQIYFEAFMV